MNLNEFLLNDFHLWRRATSEKNATCMLFKDSDLLSYIEHSKVGVVALSCFLFLWCRLWVTKKSSCRAVTQYFDFVLSRNQQISRRRSLLCGISSSCGELLWTFTKRKTKPFLVEQKELHPVVGEWWWIGHWASLCFRLERGYVFN